MTKTALSSPSSLDLSCPGAHWSLSEITPPCQKGVLLLGWNIRYMAWQVLYIRGSLPKVCDPPGGQGRSRESSQPIPYRRKHASDCLPKARVSNFSSLSLSRFPLACSDPSSCDNLKLGCWAQQTANARLITAVKSRSCRAQVQGQE